MRGPPLDATFHVLQDDSEAARKFQEVSKAYEALRDPEKRRLHDTLVGQLFVGAGGKLLLLKRACIGTGDA
jgi:DnaJ-class molecular chaperone